MENKENVLFPKLRNFFEKIDLRFVFKNRKINNSNNAIIGENNTITNNNYHFKENVAPNEYDYKIVCLCGDKKIEFDCELYEDADGDIVVTRNPKTKRIEAMLSIPGNKRITIYSKGYVFKTIEEAKIEYNPPVNQNIFYIR